MRKTCFAVLVAACLAVSVTTASPASEPPADAQSCNGFWCGYGDDKVCCHRDWNSCCRYPNSNSFYCCDR